MGLFEAFERLLNEHGSATIIREHLGFIKAKHADLERMHADLEAENVKLRAQNTELQKQARILENQISALNSGNTSGYCCDHCGCPRLTRTGNRPDPTFGRLGVKEALFLCDACGKTSAFSENPRGSL